MEARSAARLLGVGDSITAGVGAKRLQQTYPAQLTRRLTEVSGRPWVSWVVARPGMRTVDLRRQVQWEGLPPADAVVMTIGGNDLLWHARAVALRPDRLPEFFEASGQHLTVAVETIRRQTGARIFIGSVYNPYPESALAGWAVSEFNARVIRPQASPYIVVVPLHALFDGRQAEWIDGYRRGRLLDRQRIPWRRPIHPNPAGHRAIAEAFLAAMVGTGLPRLIADRAEEIPG
ncbi:MAG: GDSL-type esterase/lipase family protein [Kyrpidia sp.]|nr:GDSL-type esterase/lipase family protein [Kyrpidia sp.]